MSSAATYSAVEVLRNRRPIEIRALRKDDRADLLDAVERISALSLYRRFFGAKREFSETEIEFFLSIDFVNHVALVATVEEGSRTVIVGGGRYVIVRPGTAEVAFAVVDEYQGQGIGAALLRHLVTIAREAGLEELVAEGSTRQHTDAESVREKRSPLRDQTGGRGHSHRASTS